ncbi:MAG: 30S ribosomal protein S17 [Tenericutes bacterium]|nr:MAG: 30S ribosomal protein S17 [Mycoplasmatota bacterium]
MERTNKKKFTGVVISDKMDKTITIAIQREVRHPMYGKNIKKTTKLKAHDANNEAKMGDTVKIVETKPYSKTVTFRLLTIKARAEKTASDTDTKKEVK